MRVKFVSTIAFITPDPEKSRELLVDALGLPLTGDAYPHSEDIEGVKHLGVWPLADAAQACFGADAWPSERPIPQMSIEFDVESADAVATAAHELEERGYQLVHRAREEPWGQTVARLQSIEGAIIGISYVPSMH